MPISTIDTDAYSLKLRARAIDSERQRVLITNFTGSVQAADLSEPAKGLSRN